MTVEEVIGTLFQGEDQQLIQSLISISSMKQYKKGQDIYECGIEPKEFYILISGIAINAGSFSGTSASIISVLIMLYLPLYRKVNFIINWIINDEVQMLIFSILFLLHNLLDIHIIPLQILGYQNIGQCFIPTVTLLQL